jgi:peptide/nickel transport system ATP-binding protein
MASTPLAAKGQRRLNQIPGAMPRLDNLPTGCAFHPRCLIAQDRCTADPGPSLETCGGHAACWYAQEATP